MGNTEKNYSNDIKETRSSGKPKPNASEPNASNFQSDSLEYTE